MELRNIILGLDFGEETSQICCYNRLTKDAESVQMAKEVPDPVSFPTCLGKMLDREEWYAGYDAETYASAGNGILIDRLYEICLASHPFAVEDKEYTPGELLAVFLVKTLEKLGITDPEKQISGIVITAKRLTKPFVENVRYAYNSAGISRGRSYLQEYSESFYYYTMYQKPELRSRNVGLFLFEQREAAFSYLAVNRSTKPATVSVKKGPHMRLSEKPMDRDRDFCRLIQEALGTEIYSSIYLVGEGFDQEWASNSLRLLSRNQRRLFGGNNLFAKGACYAAREKVEERLLKGFLYLGNDLVRTNIGMEMQINGSPAYYPLISAGINWYEAEKECELILDGAAELEFLVNSMSDGKKNRYTMKLDDLPKRPPRTTRIRMRLEYDSPSTCQITAEDLGFGDLFPATHKIWKETLGEA